MAIQKQVFGPKIMCSHKPPYVLMPGDKTNTLYVCVRCERRMRKNAKSQSN